MATVAPSLLQIHDFTQILAQVPMNFAELEQAKEFLSKISSTPCDAPTTAAIQEAKYLLELKGEQSLVAQKVRSVYMRLNSLEQTLPKMESKDYYTLKKDLTQLRSDIETLPKEAFFEEIPKEKIFVTLTSLDTTLKTHDPGDWKIDATARAVLAGGLGAYFAHHPKWLESQTLPALFAKPLCDQYGTIALWGTGLGLGITAMSFAYGLEKLFPLLTTQATRAINWYTGTPAEEKTVAKGITEPAPQQVASPSIEILGPALLKPEALPLKKGELNPAKQFAYTKLTQNKAPTEPITLSKHRLESPQEALKLKPFEMPKSTCLQKEGLFAFPSSTEQTTHWTANFADPHLFGYVKGPLLAQEELLALEHPALLHLKTALDETPSLNKLEGNDIALIQNVGRYGSLTELYANKFAVASEKQIDQSLTRFEKPTISNLFAFAAPRNPGKAEQHYEKLHLQQLFLRAYTAFASIREVTDSNKQAVAHTGNWGAGAFGGSPLAAALCQILAARTAGIELCYYPLEEKEALSKAQHILEHIEKQTPHTRIGDILVHLSNNAAKYGIVYGTGNGT
jgi:hypothetical protein